MTDNIVQAPVPTNYGRGFFRRIEPASLLSAEVVVPILIELVRPNSVVDVGCGTGAWLSVFKQNGVTKVTGLDGAHIQRDSLLISASEFMPTDLSKPWTVGEIFDLALCLEVAEHLPARSARVFVESLCRLAPVICFSAAVPGQGGVEHQNEQWFSYWKNLFRAAGFVTLDPVRPLIWQDRRVAWYYRQNCYLLVRSDILDRRVDFRDLADLYADNDMMLLHDHVLATHLSLLYSLKRLPGLSISTAARILNGTLKKFEKV